MKRIPYLIMLLCALLICTSCQHTTVISREDQLNLLTQDTGTDSVPNTTAPTPHTDETADVTAGETIPNTIAQNDSPETDASTSPPSTTASSSPTDPTKITTEAPKPTSGTIPTKPDTKPDHDIPVESTETVPAPEPTTIPEKDPYDISDHTVDSLAYDIHAATNAERSAAGLPELALDGYLCAIASVRAYECSQYWSHTRPNGSEWNSILSTYGYSGYTIAAENLFQSNSAADAITVVAVWANSASHRENLLNPEFTRMGAGICTLNGVDYVVCLYTD